MRTIKGGIGFIRYVCWHDWPPSPVQLLPLSLPLLIGPLLIYHLLNPYRLFSSLSFKLPAANPIGVFRIA